MFKNIKNLIQFIFIILLIIVLGKLFLNYYNKINMEIIKKDEKDIVEQELQEEKDDLDTFLKETDINVLEEEEKDLGGITQKTPQI